MIQHVLHRTLVGSAGAAATAWLLAGAALAPALAETPPGALVSARAALHNWQCGPIADEKFSCNQSDPSSAGFTIVLRSASDLPKWNDDPELKPQIAYVAKRWFVTVQPNPELGVSDFIAVKKAFARGRR